MLTFWGLFPNHYCPLWPLTFARKVINIYIFGKPTSHTTTVPSFEFLWSIVSEKRAMLTFSATITAPYDLWPLREVIKLSIFGKPSSHTTSLASFKFLCSIVTEKSATLTLFATIIAPYDPWPLREVIKLCIFGKPSRHTTTRPRFKILWLIVSEKSPTLKFWCTLTPTPIQTPTPDESQRNASVHRLTLLRKFVKNKLPNTKMDVSIEIWTIFTFHHHSRLWPMHGPQATMVMKGTVYRFLHARSRCKLPPSPWVEEQRQGLDQTCTFKTDISHANTESVLS